MVLVTETGTAKVLGPFTGLCGPTGAAVDRAGGVYVVDGAVAGNPRVVKLAAA